MSQTPIEWRQISWAPRYEISEFGDIRKKINDTHPERRQHLYLKPEIDKDGYKRFRLENLHRLAHRIVYETFIGPLMPSLVVAHLDGSRDNNHHSNLTQVTQRENILHKKDHGTWQSGEKHPRAQITNEQARHIKAAIQQARFSKSGRLSRGEAQRISRDFEVSIYVVYELRNGSYANA